MAAWPLEFEREHGCTEAEWQTWLPDAVHGHALAIDIQGRASVAIGQGELQIDWATLQPRRIGLLRMPRMRMRYRFLDVSEPERERFMKRFDLHLLRGGG